MLSNVGLLPAAISGLNIQAIREGAEGVLNYTLNDSDVRDIPAVIGASFIVGADANQNKSINVMMPYVNRLQKFTDWYVQLWAESLGKQGRGTTPLAALGPRDQHSQLQMFLDGKKDKSFTFITTQKNHHGIKIDTSLFEAPEIVHLHGVNAFDQPRVEDGKKYAKQTLSQ